MHRQQDSRPLLGLVAESHMCMGTYTAQKVQPPLARSRVHCACRRKVWITNSMGKHVQGKPIRTFTNQSSG